MFPTLRSGMIPAHPLRRALHALTRRAPPRRRPLVVQHLGFDDGELKTLSGVLDEVGRELGVELRLGDVAGDVVLAEQGFLGGLAPQVLQAFLEERPLLAIDAQAVGTADARRRIRTLHATLVRELQQSGHAAAGELDGADADDGAGGEAARTHGGRSGFVPDSGYDSAFERRESATVAVGAEPDADCAELLNRVRRGLVDPGEQPLCAAYAGDAVLQFDFAQGSVLLDEHADQRLRIVHELPRLAEGAVPGARSRRRDLDVVAWDLALAARGQRLLHAPADWWHAPLVSLPNVDIKRYTHQPQYLMLARELARAPASPAELRRQCRVGVEAMRGFLQAMLMLGLAQWLDEAHP